MSGYKNNETISHKDYENKIKIAEEKRINEEKMVKVAHERIFYRELWVNKRIPFAKEWLSKNDKEWFEENKDVISMNQALGDKKIEIKG